MYVYIYIYIYIHTMFAKSLRDVILPLCVVQCAFLLNRCVLFLLFCCFCVILCYVLFCVIPYMFVDFVLRCCLLFGLLVCLFLRLAPRLLPGRAMVDICVCMCVYIYIYIYIIYRPASDLLVLANVLVATRR